MDHSPEKFWRRRAAWTAFRYNAGAVLAAFLPLGIGWSICFACTTLILRRNGTFAPVAWLWYGAGLLLGVAAAWRWSRRHFYTAADARVRLERHLGLHNRLTAAAAGVGSFPPAQDATDGLIFRWRRVVALAVGAAALLAATALVPMGGSTRASTPTTQPMAWTQTAGWVDALKKDETVQDAALEELRERVDQLRKQPTEDWYGHSSLEAGDNLRDQTAQSIAGLQRDLQSALGALDAAGKFGDQTPVLDQKAANEALASALKGLEMGNLPLNKDLLGQLKEANLSGLKSLTPEQMAALRKRLAQGTKVCKACLGDKPGDREAMILASLMVPGGKGGGKQSAPLHLDDKPADLGSKTTESVSNPDLSRALPGDVVGVSKGEHTVDRNAATSPTSGGAITSTGQGGEAVWRNDLTPAEREVLQRFFK